MTPAAPKKDPNLKEVSKNPTALVAGGAGFVGSHLCSTLVSQNFHVVCVDNLSSGKKENIKDILTSPNFTFIEADINNSGFTLPEGLKIDYCFHLAGIEEYQNQAEMSLDTLLVNSLGTRQLLEIAKSNNAKFILVSSADLYSGAISSSSLRYYFGKAPQGEAVLSVHEAKRFAEALSFEYFKKFNLPVTVLRLKDVYGPRMDLARGDDLSEVLQKAAKKETVVIHGDGLKTINPTYISDVVFAIVKASVGDFNGEIFILVNPEKVTVESFAQTVKLVAGPLEIEHKKENQTLEIPSPHLDLDNTREKLSWRPKVSLAEGISSVIHSLQIAEQKAETSDEMQAISIQELPPKVRLDEGSEKIAGKKPKTKLSKIIRIAIFTCSLLLIVVTVFYPLGTVAFESYFGSQNLQSAENLLENNNTEAALNQAYTAQNSFAAAEQNLLYVSWLLKIVGLADRAANFDHLLNASDKLSESIRSVARANQIVIDAANNANLTKADAEKSLNNALDELNSSKDRLEEATVLLNSVDWSKIPAKIAPKKDFVYQTSASLQKESDQLIAAINKALGKSSI